MPTLTPSALARQRLRDAVRNAFKTLDPTGDLLRAANQELAGRPINNLALSELRGLLRIMGIDPYQGTPMHPGATPPPAEDDDNARDLMTPPDATAEDDDSASATAEDAAEDNEASIVERAVADIRSDIMGGGFASLDQRLRDLVIAARKPAEVRTVEVIVERDAGNGTNPPAPRSAPTAQTVTWSKAFGVRGSAGKETATLWDGAHPDTPEVNARYVWPAETVVALTQIKRCRNVMLFGPAGCGKTEFTQQIAARLRRPFVLISCDASTDAATLVGMTVPAKEGHGVTFQPGQLARAIQTPGAVICIDEPSIARPGALFALQNVLTANRSLYVQETGQRIKVAPGVLFFATDNTSGMGGGARRGFHGTQALNSATLDRFGVRIKLGWHDAATEARILMSYVPGCTQGLADLLVSAATTTRIAAASQVLTEGLGLRRLFAWAELLSDGIDPEVAFTCAIQNCVPEDQQEALRQQCLLAVDKHTVKQALANGGDDGTMPAATLPTDPAADDFTVIPI